jgi:hypothetical protein
MSRPKCYSPEEGYMYQIVCRNLQYDREYEHCDYATDSAQLSYLIGEYSMAYGAEWQFKSITLPQKYWSKRITYEASNRLSAFVEYKARSEEEVKKLIKRRFTLTDIEYQSQHWIIRIKETQPSLKPE